MNRLSLPEGMRFSRDPERFFYALGGGEARVNFRVCGGDPATRALLRFSKHVGASVVERMASGGEPERFVLDGILFDTGLATLRPAADEVLSAAARLDELPEAVAGVEGHTDVRPIHTDEFANNYELSVGRASSVRNALVNRFGFDEDLFTARGFGPGRPIATNRTPDGRRPTSGETIAENELLEKALLPAGPRRMSSGPGLFGGASLFGGPGSFGGAGSFVGASVFGGAGVIVGPA